MILIRKDAEPDIPILKQVKAEYAKLQYQIVFEFAAKAEIPNLFAELIPEGCL